MEKGFEYWFHNQRTDLQSPYSNSLRAPFGFRQQTTAPTFTNACSDMLFPNASLPMFAVSSEQQPHMKAAQPLKPNQGWFYCRSRFRPAFAPVQNPFPKEKPIEIHREAEVQKRFVVFDQSGDQTTLLFSSGIEDSAQYQRFPSWSPKPYCAFDFKRDEHVLKGDTYHSFPPLLVGECKKEHEEDEVKSEMHEDTEELNALLYSDDDEVDYSEDEEETSTGHSPSTMTGFDGLERLEENEEEDEVASSGGPFKRQKLVHGCYGGLSLMDTASSVKTNKQCLGYEDNAEPSYCDNGKNQLIEGSGSGSLSGNKRSRKENIHEIISILQDLIPGVNKGHDAVMVLDEAIQYLTSLKVKAKAFGLDSL